MNKILYAPILNIMEERKNFIDDNYKTVEKNDEDTCVLICNDFQDTLSSE